MTKETAATNDLRDLASRYKKRFEANKRILDFETYLDMVAQAPDSHCRDAATYVRDAFDHFGSYTVDKPWGQERRWKLFDAPFDDGRDALIGQESTQAQIYRLLCGYADEGRVARLIVLNGPNGSAKSTLVVSLMRALEVYSSTPEGALYTFNWIFPTRAASSRIGFGGGGPKLQDDESFAHLLDDDIDARLSCEVRDHPLLIFPREERLELLREAARAAGREPPEKLPDMLERGGLCHKCKKVFDALLVAYHGDLHRVLQHVQVERWYISRIYRKGAVAIGPQMSVDASERQISADRSLSALPTSLQMTTLFEPHGELVDAAGGVLEFSDLLKRPLEAFRYLLGTIETGEVSLAQSILRLNTVLLATTNDIHLAAFREHPEWASFRGRISVVRVPYIRDYPTEEQIYESRIVPHVARHVAPHAVEAAARWAVLTRLLKPDLENYEEKVREQVKELTAGQKAELYATGKVPDTLKGQKAEELRAIIGELYHETDHDVDYEGRDGASPREIRAILAAATQDELSDCLTPRAVFRQIRELCGHRAEHTFLRREEKSGGYEGAEGLIDDVENAILDTIEDELRTATGLVAEERHLELLERYVLHVRHWVKEEKIFNKVTGSDEDPDPQMMKQVEDALDIAEDKVEDFRKALISTIAGYAIEHPGQQLDISKVFPDHLNSLRSSYFEKHRVKVAKVGEDILALLSEEKISASEDEENARAALSALKERFGYCDSCVKEALSDLIKARYSIS